MQIDTAALRALAEKATQGPWTTDLYGVRNRNGYICEIRWPSHFEWQDDRHQRESMARKADAELIAALDPATVTQLLDGWDALRELVERSQLTRGLVSKYERGEILDAELADAMLEGAAKQADNFAKARRLFGSEG